VHDVSGGANQMGTLAFRIFSPLVRVASCAPKGRLTLMRFFIRLASNDQVTPSVYGPALQTRWHDATFRFCVFGSYGHYLSDFLTTYPTPFSFIDIGANIGLYSLIAAQSRNCQACYSFEPNPEVFKSLQGNIVINGYKKIHSYNSAVTTTEGKLRFSATREHSGAGALDATGEIMVSTVNRTAFNVIAEADEFPKIVKIDVEGHEPMVIREVLNSAVASQVCNIYFEADESRYDVSAVTSELLRAGFIQIFRNGVGKPYDLMFERA
jgi:FkbM family methyltransferase